MPRSRVSDLLGVLKGAQSVTNALIKHQEDAMKHRITHSSLKNLPEKYMRAVRKGLSDIDPSKLSVSSLNKSTVSISYVLLISLVTFVLNRNKEQRILKK